MSRYIDGFVLPVPKDRVGEYRALAEIACAVWKEHGALEYSECIGEDLHPPMEAGVRSFPEFVGAREGETVMFSWAVFESREARDAANEKIFADPRLAEAMDMENPIFECARMAWGGFSQLVHG